MADWRPSASLAALQQRAKLNTTIRHFFDARGVLEVETPLLMKAKAAEQHLKNFRFGDYALQTSPESAMKRLLCADVGPIYQLAKAFRLDELGQRHNPEFTMLEWYQPQYSFEQMIQETVDLIEVALGETATIRSSYNDVFQAVTGLCAHSCQLSELASYASQHIDGQFSEMSRSDWLDLIMSCCVEPTFDQDKLTLIDHFPSCQAALARLSRDQSGHSVALRFEIYSGGLELANGYHEECDPIVLSHILGNNDPQMLAAFQDTKMSSCCGVALGLDRLLMLQGGYDHIAEVLSFDFLRA